MRILTPAHTEIQVKTCTLWLRGAGFSSKPNLCDVFQAKQQKQKVQFTMVV
jgi:hypothetical protein